MSQILKMIALPLSLTIICLGVYTILGGHITPGGGFQGGAMIAGAVILCVLVYGIDKTPIKFSHDFISSIESIGALGYVLIGVAGLIFSGFYLYNVGTDFYSIVPHAISNIFHYDDPTNAGMIPYISLFIGLKVFVGLSAIAIAFYEFKN